MPHRSLRIVIFATSFVPCVCLAQNGVKVIPPSPATVVDGGQADVKAEIEESGRPAPGTTVTFSVNQCGSVKPNKPITPAAGAVPAVAGQVKTTFTGGPLTTPFTNCTATVTATVNRGSISADITVTPTPVPVQIPGAAAVGGKVPEVTITATVLSTATGFSADYVVAITKGYSITKIFVSVPASSNFTSTPKGGPTKVSGPGESATFSMPATTEDQITIKSENTGSGTAAFTVFVEEDIHKGNPIQVGFGANALPGPKK